MRVAVTGASGFIGGWLARLLADEGHEVLSYGRRPEAALTFPLPNYRRWDIASGVLAAPAVDAVVHAAALVGDWGPWRPYHAINVLGTRHVLASFPARQVHISSASVYAGDLDGSGLYREDHPLATSFANAYVRSKVEAEREVAAFPTTTILRPHVVYGPGDATLMPRLLAARRGGRLLVPGTGRNHLSVTHVFNLAQAVSRALRPNAPAGTYNVADDEAAPVDELLRTILGRYGEPVRIGHLPTWAARPLAVVLEAVWRGVRSHHAPLLTRYLVDQLTGEHRLDISKIRRELKYAPRWTFRDGPLR